MQEAHLNACTWSNSNMSKTIHYRIISNNRVERL